MVCFDDAIPTAIALIKEKLASKAGSVNIHIVRDTSGAIVVVLPDSALPADDWDIFATKLDNSLGRYSPGEARILLRESDLIDPVDVLESPDKIALDVANVWLIDRLLTNQDWVRAPLRKKPRVPTAVAYSVKGGVGRSTAFSMFAWYLARKGRDILVVDLDLEAPGIGGLLLPTLPKKGLVDWLIESFSGQQDMNLLEDSIGEATVAHDCDGRIRVLSAQGRDSSSYISKLGRIYAPNIDANNRIVGLAERLDNLLEAIMNLPQPPEVVLLDSRAGLHDIGSAAVTRLGAEVFLFSRNDNQDWWAYHQLFTHLKTSRGVAHGMGNDDDLRWKLKMVAAQTPANEADRRNWIERSYDEWIDFYDDESVGQTADFAPTVFDRDDIEAPHHPLFINFDAGVRSLSLLDTTSRPAWGYIQAIFGDFFLGAEQRLWPETAAEFVEGNL